MYPKCICGSTSLVYTNSLMFTMRRLIQNKKKHKISRMLILTSLNSFCRISFFYHLIYH